MNSFNFAINPTLETIDAATEKADNMKRPHTHLGMSEIAKLLGVLHEFY